MVQLDDDESNVVDMTSMEVATPNGATTVTLVVEDDDDDIEFVPNDGELTGINLKRPMSAVLGGEDDRDNEQQQPATSPWAKRIQLARGGSFDDHRHASLLDDDNDDQMIGVETASPASTGSALSVFDISVDEVGLVDDDDDVVDLTGDDGNESQELPLSIARTSSAPAAPMAVKPEPIKAPIARAPFMPEPVKAPIAVAPFKPEPLKAPIAVAPIAPAAIARSVTAPIVPTPSSMSMRERLAHFQNNLNRLRNATPQAPPPPQAPAPAVPGVKTVMSTLKPTTLQSLTQQQQQQQQQYLATLNRLNPTTAKYVGKHITQGTTTFQDTVRSLNFMMGDDNAFDGVSGSDETFGEVPEEEALKNILDGVKNYLNPSSLPTPPEFRADIKLLKHQEIGLHWLVTQEDNPKFRGGLLADEMGLGKTVQTIGLICHNKPTDEDRKQTLIVGPVAVLDQWMEEIANKTKPGTFSIGLYHGTKCKRTKKWLSNFDIVLTSYSILGQEYPKDAADMSGPLLQIKWFRVVLDESHLIKNKDTRSARGACALRAERRWCLSGTPIQNSMDDVYSLFKFLDIQPYCEL